MFIEKLLQANPDNVIEAEVSGKRKREVGLIVPAKYTAYMKVKSNASILCEKLCEKNARLSNFELVHASQCIVKKHINFEIISNVLIVVISYCYIHLPFIRISNIFSIGSQKLEIYK